VTILHHTAILILVAVIAFPVALIMLAQLAALSKRPCPRKTEWVDLYMICQRLPPQHDAPYSAIDLKLLEPRTIRSLVTLRDQVAALTCPRPARHFAAEKTRQYRPASAVHSCDLRKRREWRTGVEPQARAGLRQPHCGAPLSGKSNASLSPLPGGWLGEPDPHQPGHAWRRPGRPDPHHVLHAVLVARLRHPPESG
jgi:hypothetical protein